MVLLCLKVRYGRNGGRFILILFAALLLMTVLAVLQAKNASAVEVGDGDCIERTQHD